MCIDAFAQLKSVVSLNLLKNKLLEVGADTAPLVALQEIGARIVQGVCPGYARRFVVWEGAFEAYEGPARGQRD